MMKCNCGAQLEQGARFCSRCGANVSAMNPTPVQNLVQTMNQSANQSTTTVSAGRLKQFLMVCVLVGLMLCLIGFGGEYATGQVLNYLKQEMIDPSDTSGMSEFFADYLGDTAKDLIVSVVRNDPELLKTGVKSMTDLFEKGMEEDPFTESLTSLFFNSMVEPLFGEARDELIRQAGVYWPLLQIVAYYPEFQNIGLVLLIGGAVLLFLTGYRIGGQPRVKKHIFVSVIVTLVIVGVVAHIDVPNLVKQVVALVQSGEVSDWTDDASTQEQTSGSVTQYQAATATPRQATATAKQTATPTPKRTATPTPKRTTAPTNPPVQSSRYPLFQGRYVNPVGKTVEFAVSDGNARSGPGTAYTPVAILNQGERYYVYASELGDTGKDWYQISVNGKRCWVSSGLVRIDGYLDGTVNGVPIVPDMTERRCTVRSTQANARTGAGMGYTVVTQVYAGEEYAILDCRIGSDGLDWYKISRSGQVCWVRSDLVYVNTFSGGTVEGVLVGY